MSAPRFLTWEVEPSGRRDVPWRVSIFDPDGYRCPILDRVDTDDGEPAYLLMIAEALAAQHGGTLHPTPPTLAGRGHAGGGGGSATSRGWRFVGVDYGGCSAGDDAIHEAAAYYDRPGERIEWTFYVVQLTGQFAGHYGVCEMTYHRHGPEDYPDAEEYDYGEGSPTVFRSLPDAVAEADRLAVDDWTAALDSWAPTLGGAA